MHNICSRTSDTQHVVHANYIYKQTYTTHLFDRSFVYFLYSFVQEIYRSLVHSFFHSFVQLFVLSFVHSFVCLFRHLFVCSFIRSFVLSFICSFVRLFIYSFVFFIVGCKILTSVTLQCSYSLADDIAIEILTRIKVCSERNLLIH